MSNTVVNAPSLSCGVSKVSDDRRIGDGRCGSGDGSWVGTWDPFSVVWNYNFLSLVLMQNVKNIVIIGFKNNFGNRFITLCEQPKKFLQNINCRFKFFLRLAYSFKMYFILASSKTTKMTLKNVTE